ncbi:LOW QUALITY PROTEIN: discoidin domain-containing receptor 2-like [Dreissena polymorpha]|uniref:LOW QUALITY PROTEIN: discoidin domain-containing receptor 2-like n=1 Tax=Dreissena polymorpha TaxID=45954 RepID=UPI002263BCA6|nr:LOW QUALITY PROTEIN: discoidin domain-containing receptor 2-like [Dreissena polymorpha]
MYTMDRNSGHMKSNLLCLCILLILDLRTLSSAFDLATCHAQLGMEDNRIPDEALTASSTHNHKSVGPHNARIRQEKNGGAWCPNGFVTKDSYEYLQIDLGRLMAITKVEVQGRFGNGQGMEFAAEFLLEYQRQDGGEWIRFRNKLGNEHFEGNENTYLEVMRDVSPPIIGKRIRFIPFSQNSKTVCMRVEMYGCPWSEGLLSYSMRQGDTRGSENDFFDFTYDGTLDPDGYLYRGLGQLTDGEKGEANFRLANGDTNIKGYEWVGWRNDTTHGEGPVEITFQFETVRNFSSVKLTCNNYFSKNVRVFRQALVFFSVGGMFYINNPVTYDYMQDRALEASREVKIDLGHKLGKFVKLKLAFDAKWILISEVEFESVPAEGNFTIEEEPKATMSDPTPAPNVDKTAKDELRIVDVNVESSDIGLFHGDANTSRDDGSVTSKTAGEKASATEDYVSIIIGALAALIVILTIVVIFVVIRYRRRRNQNRQSLKPVSDTVLNINLNNFQNNITNGKVSNGNVYNGVATEEDEHVKDVNGKALPPMTSPMTPVTTSQHSTAKSKHQNSALNALDKPPTYDALYAASDVISSCVPNIPSLQGVSGNNVYAVPNSDILVSSVDCALVEFPRRNLRFVEVLGEGEFGEVHLCEAFGLSDPMLPGSEYMMGRRRSGPVLVSVKILRKTADDRARSDFHREMKVMSMLKDPNIVRVLGVCTTEEPLCMIVEYMKYGDLNQFLLEHVSETHVQTPNAKILSYGCLVYMASQIASGMKYLESLNMVHRDLATRNCLVGPFCTIKISDFGMSRSLYSADYYRIEGRAVLPIRWMGWESILLGKFTTKSDVWSFAVTLWEILTFAREQPFEGMTDEEVISNAGHYYRNDNEHVVLSHPPNCPKEIYDLMCECWNRQESERPSFREINMFLCRKNMGYDPRHDNLDHVS